jgi:hypothetical protein
MNKEIDHQEFLRQILGQWAPGNIDTFIETLSRQIWASNPEVTADRKKLAKIREYAEDIGLVRLIEILDEPVS